MQAFNYRLAPETRFPGALYDSVQCYLYLIHNCGIDPSNVIMMGDSAGGGLCMALLLYLRDHHLPLPRGAILLSVNQHCCIVMIYHDQLTDDLSIT